jgi:cysteine-rich repeat protein
MRRLHRWHWGLAGVIAVVATPALQAQPITCGNGVVNPGETCDDGNSAGGDGCGATCITEPGFTCASAGAACVAICGDSIRAGAGRFREDCDDGNTRAGDGCSATCVSEFGYGCRDTTTNLAPNGDFVMGRVGFTSDYTFDDSRNMVDGYGGGGPEGNFTVTSNPAGWNGVFRPIGAVTWADANGDGFAALFNGIGVRTAYRANVLVEAGRDYVVQFNVADWGGLNPLRPMQRTALLVVTVNGTPVTPQLRLRASDGVQMFWDFVGGTYRATTSGAAVFQVVDNEPTDQGNDFAIDGISFRPVSPMVCSTVDTDMDTIPDLTEGPSRDTDMDGTPDFRDPDDDGDTIPTVNELGPGGGMSPRDSDTDGTPDYRDPDDDNDTVPTRDELGPMGFATPRNTDMSDNPDWLDPDDDNDTIPTRVEQMLDMSAGRDADMDGTPSYRDLDSDGDMDLDRDEAGSSPATPVNTDMATGSTDGPDFLDRDSDNDCIPDSDPREDGAARTNAMMPSVNPDTNCGAGMVCNRPSGTCGAPGDRDGDGIPDMEETRIGTNPDNPDTDGDTIRDGDELGPGGSMTPRDSDMDGMIDARDPDDDNDTVPTRDELGTGGFMSPRNTDMTDNPDWLDPDDDNDTIPTAVERTLDTTPDDDADMDMAPSYRDLDSDADGDLDRDEAGANPMMPANTDGGSAAGDGPDFLDRDSDNDCLPDSDPREDGAARTNAMLPSASADANCTMPGLPVCNTTVGMCVARGDAGVPDGGTTMVRNSYQGDGFACTVNPGSNDANGLGLLALGALAVAIPSLRRRRRSGK